jgi:hypothetical protein
MEIKWIKPYGIAECSVVGCYQRVQDRSEATKKKKMCYAHRKMENGLVGRLRDYCTDKENHFWRYGEWDLRTEDK